MMKAYLPVLLLFLVVVAIPYAGASFNDIDDGNWVLGYGGSSESSESSEKGSGDEIDRKVEMQ